MKFRHLVNGKLAGTIAFEQTGDTINYGISIVSPKEKHASRSLGKEISQGRLLSQRERDWGEYNSRKEGIELVEILKNVGLKKRGTEKVDIFRRKIATLASILSSFQTM